MVALAIMFGASRQAARRIPPGARAPLIGARIASPLLLWALPGAAFLLSLWFVMEARDPAQAADMAVIVFGIRAVSASLLALLHLRWLGDAMKALDREGVLKP